MIWALLYIVIFGGGGQGTFLGGFTTKYLKDQVETTVQDPQRREEALRALKTTQGHIDDLTEHHADDMEAFRKVVEDYHSSSADFDRLVDAKAAERLRDVDQIWSDRAALLKHVNAEEWTAIFAGAREAAAKDAAKASKEK